MKLQLSGPRSQATVHPNLVQIGSTVEKNKHVNRQTDKWADRHVEPIVRYKQMCKNAQKLLFRMVEAFYWFKQLGYVCRWRLMYCRAKGEQQFTYYDLDRSGEDWAEMRTQECVAVLEDLDFACSYNVELINSNDGQVVIFDSA